MKRVKKFPKIIVAVYSRMIAQKKQEIMFWVLYSFLFTFIIARLTARFLPNLFLSWNGAHIHHFAYGFIILAITGLASLNDLHHKKPRSMAITYGIGLGSAVDEFAMWIHLKDDYWIRQSYDAVFIVGGVLFSFLYFSKFWRALFKATESFVFKRVYKIARLVKF